MASHATQSSPARERRSRSDHFSSRRAEIVDIAAHLFATNGYAATGIARIGDEAHLARGALYYYIKSKETLLGEIHDRVMDPLLSTAAEVAGLDAPVEVRLRLISEALLTQIIERHDHVWVFLHEYRSLTGQRLQHFRSRRRQFEDYISALLNEGRTRGRFDFDDTRLATLAFLNLHNYSYQWIRAESRFSAAELSRFFCRVFLGGISTSSNASDLEASVSAIRATP